MSLFKKFLYRKPPDGLLEISERVYVFDCCFTTDVLEDEEYKDYMGGKAGQLRQHFLDASFMVFNFRKGEKQSQISNILSDYDMIVMDYPCQYEGCPLLTMEMIHHCLRSGESWLSLGQQSILLMHCERGGWPILAFTLAALLIYRKQFTGEHKTLEMVYKQAPRELLQLMSPLNPLPSQLRYLQYISRRNVASEWPPRDRSLILDCIILRVIPNLVGDGGIRPIFRIYGPDPFAAFNRTPKVLFSTPKKSKFVRHHKQADCELVKIDINCSVQGDVVLECINLDSEQERESMMFRVMFNTAFIRSNILMLNREEIEILWDTKDQFPKDFRAEVLFSEMDSATSRVSIDLLSDEEKDGLPIEAFTKIQEIFNQADWIGPKAEGAINVLQQIKASDVLQEDMNAATPRTAPLLESTIKKVKGRLEALNDNTRSPASSTFSTLKPSIDPNSIQKKFESHEPHDEKLTSATSISQEEQSLKSSIEPVSIQKKIESHELQEEQSIPSLKPSVDLNSVQKKIESHDMRVATQRPAQAKIISPQIAQASMPSPTSTAQAKITLSPTSSSSPTSHSPVSRYQDMSSALGITALLHDHAASKGEESPSAISSPTITNLPKSMHLPTLPSPTSPPLPPGHALPSSTEKSRSAPPPPPPPPLPVSKATDYSLSQSSGPIETRVQSSLVPPMPPSLPSYLGVTSTPTTTSSHSTPLSPPLPPLFPIKNSCSVPSPPPPPSPTSFSRESPSSAVNNSFSPSPPPLPAAGAASSAASRKEATSKPPPPPPPPLLRSASATSSTPAMSSAPQPPPPPPGPAPKGPLSNNPPVPPPPAAPPPAGPLVNGKADSAFPQSNSGISNVPCINAPPVPGPPSVSFGSKARGLSRPTAKTQAQTRKANLKPYHWLKLTRAVQGSLWAETQKTDDSSKAPEFDMSELESLFSVAAPNTNKGNADGKSNRRGPKTEKIQLIELRRAYNCEIMLTKVKVPLPDLMSSLLALDSSALDVDQVDNLIKFCPTKEEMESLKGYKGDKENLGKCEQFFLELMKVPRVESKLRVFSFKIQFCTQISDLRKNLNTVNSAAEEVRNSAKLKKIMQTILSLGNALNHGTARGSAIGFRLDSLLKLTETRARNNKMTLMHYLCKILAEKLPELLDFYKDLQSLEAATKIQLKFLAEEMQAVSRGLEKVIQEFAASENDGLVSANFCANLKEFLGFAEGEVRSLASLYSSVGRSADALALYFGEDPARVPFEQVVATLLNFVRMFVRAHDENCKQIELEEKKAQKEAANEKSKSAPKKESQEFSDSPVKRNNIK